MELLKLQWTFKEHPNASLCRYFKTEEELLEFKKQHPNYNYGPV